MHIFFIPVIASLVFNSYAVAKSLNLKLKKQAQQTHHERTKNQLQKSEEIFQKNPRNPAFSESFKGIESGKKGSRFKKREEKTN